MAHHPRETGLTGVSSPVPPGRRDAYRRSMTTQTRPDDDVVIDARRVVKSFGRTRALAGLDLQVLRGEVHGFSDPTVPGRPPPSVCCSACSASTQAR